MQAMGQLPRLGMSLIGRSRERDALTALLAREDVKLITLTGPGGTGKSALAVEVAQSQLGRFEHGAWFVNLAPLSDASMVAGAIAHVLGLQQGGARLSERLHDYMRDRSLLLVLDNFETVLLAGLQLSSLLDGAKRVKIIVTSRARLDVPFEHELPVPPLEVATDAVQLFMERAKAADPGLKDDAETRAAVATLCARLDGLPLAVELAAARMKSLGPKALLERIEKSPLGVLFQEEGRSRHRTLRGTIAWSYRLLSSNPQKTFAWLSVFRGGFTSDDVARLCGELGRADLDTLRQHNLIREENGRLDMLQTVRDFAEEMLVESAVAEVAREKHAEMFGTLARELGRKVQASAKPADLDTMELELDNLRAALAFYEKKGTPQPGLELAVALGRFFDMRGYWLEGRRWLTAFATPATSAHVRARALNLAGIIAFRQGETNAAKALHEEALQLGDELAQLDAIDRLQWCAMYSGRTDEGVALSLKGWELAQKLDDPRRRARAKGQRGWAVFEQGRREEAEALYAQAVKELEEAGDAPDLAYMLNAIGEVQRRACPLRAGPRVVRTQPRARAGRRRQATDGSVPLQPRDGGARRG